MYYATVNANVKFECVAYIAGFIQTFCCIIIKTSQSIVTCGNTVNIEAAVNKPGPWQGSVHVRFQLICLSADFQLIYNWGVKSLFIYIIWGMKTNLSAKASAGWLPSTRL